MTARTKPIKAPQKAVDTFWMAALGDNSKLANLAKAAIAELEAAAQSVPHKSDGKELDRWIAESAHLNCPACGGSGHIDDVKPVPSVPEYIANGTRYKVQADGRQSDARIYGLPKELNGCWVALVDATDNRHMAAAAPEVNS